MAPLVPARTAARRDTNFRARPPLPVHLIHDSDQVLSTRVFHSPHPVVLASQRGRCGSLIPGPVYVVEDEPVTCRLCSWLAGL